METQRAALPDWAYPAEEHVPETLLHLMLRTRLLAYVRHYLATRGVRALTGSDQFVYWVEGNPRQAVAPDLYVVLDEDPARDVRVWKTWEEGRAPDFAFEVVSDDVHKDYEIVPMRYAEIGVRELIIFDPHEGRSRVRWQVYRRDAAGELVRALSTDADRVRSEVLDCFVRLVTTPAEQPDLRLAEGPNGDQLVLSEVEAERLAKEQAIADKERALADKERALADKERALADKEQALAEAQREQALRRAAEAELAALRARLATRDDDASDG